MADVAMLLEAAVTANVAGFSHDFRIMWDETGAVSVWMDGSQVGGVWGVTMGVQMPDLSTPHGEMVHTKEITLVGDDHPLADTMADAGFRVLIVSKEAVMEWNKASRATG